MLKRFILYLVRWQLSTPILWLVVRSLGVGFSSTVIANLVGGSMFFWVDKFIFTSPALEVWHYKDEGRCAKCDRETELWRLVRAKSYDKTDAHPIFLCTDCSAKKLERLRKRGIQVTKNSKGRDKDVFGADSG